LLDQEGPAVGWPTLVSLLKEHVIDLSSLFEEVGAQVGLYRLHPGEKFALTHVSTESTLNEALHFVFSLVEVVLVVNQRGSIRETIG
jgi:hypothetical protein